MARVSYFVFLLKTIYFNVKINRCNATCGTGLQKRFRKIKVEASCGGDVCDGERVQISHCNTHCCPGELCSFKTETS